MKKLKSIFIKALNLPEKLISYSLSIKNCEEWDSANHMAIIIQIEKTFKIKLKQSEIAKMTSYLKIEQILKKKLNLHEKC